MSLLKISDKLCHLANPCVYTAEKERLFIDAMRENLQFHSLNSPETRFLFQKYRFRPEDLKSEKDLERIPTIGVTAMKYFLLLSRPEKEAVLKLTSSGTRGQKTQIWFDQESLDRAQNMLENVWEDEGLVSKTPTNYLNFIYDPKDSEDLGIAFSVNNEQRFAPVKESFFALQKVQGEWKFQKEACVAKLIEYSKQDAPVRIMGVPSFFFEILEALPHPIPLPKGSYAIMGGGWKNKENKQVSKDFFRMKVGESFNIPAENIRDNYGMAEHGAPFKECREHRFHIPIYSRILIRDPHTLKSLPAGEVGLMQLLTPYHSLMPNFAVLTTDLGKVSTAKCKCGKNSPTFEIVGRGGNQKYKGCAIQAQEIVSRGSK